SSVKHTVRQVLLRTLPAPIYWELWNARRGSIREEVPVRMQDEAGWLQSRLEGSHPYLRTLLSEFPPPTMGWPRYFEHNPSFEAGDAEVYYALLRKYQPNLVIEVGVGYSSHIAIQALK